MTTADDTNDSVFERERALIRQSPQAGSAGPDQGLALLIAHAQKNPRDARSQFELAGAYDFLGRELDALPHYCKVVELGVDTLPAADQPRLHVQLGSTLRNLGMLAEARAVLTEGRKRFPDCGAILAFLALTEYSDGYFRRAARLMFAAMSSSDGSLQTYRRALAEYGLRADYEPVVPAAKTESEVDEST